MHPVRRERFVSGVVVVPQEWCCVGRSDVLHSVRHGLQRSERAGLVVPLVQMARLVGHRHLRRILCLFPLSTGSDMGYLPERVAEVMARLHHMVCRSVIPHHGAGRRVPLERRLHQTLMGEVLVGGADQAVA